MSDHDGLDDVATIFAFLRGRQIVPPSSVITIVSPGESMSLTAGNGITLTPNPITGDGTIAIDTSIAVDKTTAQALTNKAIDGSQNTLSNVAQSVLSSLRNPVSISDLANVHRANVNDDAGSYTYGEQLMPVKSGLVLLGLKFFWPGGHGALTVRCSLYYDGAARITYVDVAVNAAGVYTGTFAAAQTLTEYTAYNWTVWETSGARNIYMTNANIVNATGGVMAAADFNGKSFWPGYYRLRSIYAAGDASPATPDAADVLGLIDPVFQ